MATSVASNLRIGPADHGLAMTRSLSAWSYRDSRPPSPNCGPMSKTTGTLLTPTVSDRRPVGPLTHSPRTAARPALCLAIRSHIGSRRQKPRSALSSGESRCAKPRDNSRSPMLPGHFLADPRTIDVVDNKTLHPDVSRTREFQGHHHNRVPPVTPSGCGTTVKVLRARRS